LSLTLLNFNIIYC